MLFRRRKPLSFLERIRLALWPSRGWVRSMKYILFRLKRLPSSPYRIAVGGAVGVFVVFTPFLGVQLLMAAIVAWMLRGSIIASVLTSFVGNPLTYPVIWVATFHLGTLLLGNSTHVELGDIQDKVGALGDAIGNGSGSSAILAIESLWPIMKPMAVGSLPLGGLAALVTYICVHRLVKISRAARERRKLDLQTAWFGDANG